MGAYPVCADSVYVCLMLLKELGYSLAVAHINHGLRGAESDEDARFTQELSERLNLPFFSTTPDIQAYDQNLENAGRLARKEFFNYLTTTQGFGRIALAHTSDDRGETFFLNLLRGAGPDGLTSMEPVKGRIIRPLIEISRAEVEAYLKSIGQPWRTDASNLDLRLARDQVRHSVIPELATRLIQSNLKERLSAHHRISWKISVCGWLGLPKAGLLHMEFAAPDEVLYRLPGACQLSRLPSSAWLFEMR